MAKQLPQIWYGLHFYPGIAEYREEGQAPLRVFLNENTLRDMDPTFAGRPVFVRHVEEVDLKNLQTEADGYVVKSFYNEADGKHWVQFIVVSDKGHEAIRNGFKLSNAYLPKSYGPSGMWNGLEYTKEITAAEYEHLALVNDPRYNESKVLSPEEFKEYNNSKLTELKRVANSKSSEKRSMFDFFKKTKVENAELEETIVKLPNTGKEISIKDLIKNADTIQNVEKGPLDKEGDSEKEHDKVEKHAEHKDGGENKEEQEKQGRKKEEPGAAPQMANEDHHVRMGNGTMSVRDLMAKHKSMEDCMNALAMHHADMMKKNVSEDGGEKDAEKAAEADLTKRNADLDSGEKEAEKQEKEEDKTKRNSHFDKLKNAADLVEFDSGIVPNLDGVLKGKAKYGSGK